IRLFGTTARGCRIINCDIRASGASGISNEATDNILAWCNVGGSGQHAIYNNGFTSKIDHCQLFGCTIDGLRLAADGVTVVGCTFQYSPQNGIYVNGGANISVVGCLADGNGASGFAVGGNAFPVLLGGCMAKDSAGAPHMHQYGFNLFGTSIGMALGCSTTS